VKMLIALASRHKSPATRLKQNAFLRAKLIPEFLNLFRSKALLLQTG
jgi:hypothetical protein